jgi:hypothetical protein
MLYSKTYGLQKETRNYLRRLYAFNRELAPSDIVDIDNFIKGTKQLGFWQNMVCWPLRSQQNIGSGSTVLSFGGLENYNGTMVNTTTWSLSGIQSGGATFSGSQINISTTIRRVINFGATIFGVASNAGDDNYVILRVEDSSDGNPTYPTLVVNQANSTGVIPVVTRNSTRYFQSNRGGAYSAGFSSVASVIRITSQANFRNGTLIANETNLGVINPDSQTLVNLAFIAGRGNGTITGGGVISPICLVSTVMFSNEQITNLHNLYKTTIGKGLGLP